MTYLGMEQPSPTERQPRACEKCHKTMRHLADLRSVGAFPAVKTFRCDNCNNVISVQR
jgi:hypothetical protein